MKKCSCFHPLVVCFAVVLGVACQGDTSPDTASNYSWHTFFGGDGYDGFGAVAVDETGSICVAGMSDSSWLGPGEQSPLNPFHEDGDPPGDVFILKLSSDAEYQWHSFVGGVGIQDGVALAIDGDGNIYVVGSSHNGWSGPEGEDPLHPHAEAGEDDPDLFVIKLGSGGQYQWHTYHGGVGFDYGLSLAVDPEGNVHVSGSSGSTWDGPAGEGPVNDHSNDCADALVLKLDANGGYLWHTFHDSDSYDCSESGKSLVVGDSGNVYVTGSSFNSDGDGESLPDSFALKLNPAGEQQWLALFGPDGGRSIAVDGDDNLYVTGFSSNTWNGPDGQSPLNPHFGGSYSSNLFVVKLDEAGGYLWHTFHGEGQGAEQDSFSCVGSSIAVGQDGDLLVTGGSSGTWNGPDGQAPVNEHSGYHDAFVLELDADGAYSWHAFFGANADADIDEGASIALDGAGNIYSTGVSESTWNGPNGEAPVNTHAGDYDIYVLKLTDLE
jgi:hypothetical protein